MTILGCMIKKIQTLMVEETTPENNTSPSYDTIVNLVAASCKELPWELVVEILCKLPVESLIRFKTVCKSWKLLINGNVFIDIHLHRKNPQIRRFNLYRRMEQEQLLPQENLPKKDQLLPFDNFFFVGSCNGIICLKPCDIKNRLFLWNPSTKEFSFLSLECDDVLCFGFVYLSKTQEYQIIGFRKSKRDHAMIDILVVTLGKTTSMREVKDVVVPRLVTNPMHATSGTTMFWLGVDDNKKDIVIFYDMIEERFSKMNAPPSSSSSSSRSIRGYGDLVAMFVYPEFEPTFFDIWILIDDVTRGNSWRKYRKIGPLETKVIMKPIDICWEVRQILCSKDGSDNEHRSKNFYYDLETGQVKDYMRSTFIHKTIDFVESLASINSLVPYIDKNN